VTPTLTVTPDSDLLGGQTVEVQADSFGSPGQNGAWCQGITGPSASADYCASGTVNYDVLDADSRFGGSSRIQRFVYVPAAFGWADCADGVSVCTIGAAVEDLSIAQAGVITFAPPPAPPATRGTISVSAPGLRPGGAAAVTGVGVRPDTLVDLFQCRPGALPTHPRDCGLSPVSVLTDASGGFTADLVTAADVAPPGAGAVSCLGFTQLCQVVAAEAADFPGTAAAAPLLFALPTPQVLPGAGQVIEGADGTGTLSVPVTLSRATNVTVTVPWRTFYVPDSLPHEADPATDYTAASGTVTFVPGDQSETITIEVSGDTTTEADEWILVLLSMPTNASLAGWGISSGTIVNDDAPPTVLPGGTTASEGDTGNQVVEVPVPLSNPSDLPVTVDWQTAFDPSWGDGAATPGLDHVAASGSVTFAPGETARSVPVTILGDTTPEPDELVVLSFLNPVNARIGGFWGLAFAGIADDD
jgi:hypothetical protein